MPAISDLSLGMSIQAGTETRSSQGAQTRNRKTSLAPWKNGLNVFTFSDAKPCWNGTMASLQTQREYEQPSTERLFARCTSHILNNISTY